ncbi:unnamed protein product [Cyclocybe aegerita]|uniref:Uncharacterized protein n=1 Tax=Cyclocybe aegerita TaxID=1973307 RepID=A0A8S0XJ42_CYCAE|nr:unnamed protein product [Cyclocybe aegerita]
MSKPLWITCTSSPIPPSVVFQLTLYAGSITSLDELNLPSHMSIAPSNCHSQKPRTNLSDFHVPPPYGYKYKPNRRIDLVMFGFPISHDYLLEYAQRNKICPNHPELSDRQLEMTALHCIVAYAAKRFDAEWSPIDIPKGLKYSTKVNEYAIVIASNRTQAHLDRMKSYPHFRQLATFLGLPPSAATWVFPMYSSERTASDLRNEKNKVV